MTARQAAAPALRRSGKGRFAKFRQQWMLQTFALMGMAFLVIFCVIPMFGIVLSFNNYKPKLGLAGFVTSDWVGLKWFQELFSDSLFWPILRNTVALSVLKLVFSFPMPILFALVLNEVRHSGVKRVVQTVSYLPHFISWVVVHGILVSFLNLQNGVFNQFLVALGGEAIPFLSGPQYFWGMVVITNIWKEMGWGAIIFLAAISGVDVAMYEAAVVDGASRMRRIWHITLPSIKPTIVVLLILNIANLLGTGLFEPCFLLGNNVNKSTSEILQTYTLRVGLENGRYSYAAAVGLVQSVVAFALVVSSNFVAKRVSGSGLF